MSFPVFIDEVALASAPFDDPQVWTDLSDRTRLRSWSRGRQTEDDRPTTGRSTTVFENTDRALDTENAGSVYAGEVLPMRRVRCTVTVDATTYYLHSTFVDPLQGWQITQDSPGYAEVTAVANDGFDVLATAQFSDLDGFPQQSVADRIVAILDLFEWPAGEREIDTTDASQIQAAVAGTLTGQSALDQIQAATDTEDGVFFIDGRGFAIFRSRYYSLVNTRGTESQATFVDADSYDALVADGPFLYTSLTPSSSKIVNDYLVTRAGGTQVEALDETSKTLYRLRSKTLDTLHLTDAAAFNFGAYKLGSTKDPHRRYDEMVVTPCDDDDVWLKVFQLEIGDRITVAYSPPGGGDPDVRDMHIEAVSFDVGPGVTATVTYRLSPASQVIGWIAGVSHAGVDTIGVY